MKKLAGICAALALTGAAQADVLAYWRFGDKGLEDCSGHNIELVNTNVELDSTGAAIFNGTDAFLETKESLDLTAYNKLTIECWFKPEYPAEASTDFMPLFLHCLWDSTNGNAPGSIVTYFSGNENGLKTFRSQLRDGDWSGGWTYTRVNGTADNYPMMDGAWHHVALVMDLTATWSDKAKLYIDGVRMPGTESMSAAAIPSFSNFKFILGGGGTYVPGDFFHGAIDDVRISTGALEPSQFLKFPTVGRHQSPENPAVAYWPFGSKELTDVTGNGFDFQPADPATIGFGNDSIQIGGKGLVSAAAIPAQAFTHSGLTYECFVQTTSTVDLSVLLEISPVYYNSWGCNAFYLESGNSRVATYLRTFDNGYNGKVSVPGSDDAATNDGLWHHVALVYDPAASGADRYRAYLDGRALPPSAAGESSDAITYLMSERLYLGARNLTDYPFVGSVDDVRIMPWALTPSEFLKARSTDAELAHWKFDSAETALVDKTGNGYDFVNYDGVQFTDGSAYFNGQNARLITSKPLALSGSSQMTIEGHFRFEDAQKIGVLFGCEDTAPVGGYVVYGMDGKLMSQFRNVASTSWQQHVYWGYSGLVDGAWHHLAFVVNATYRNNAQSQLWIDGALVDDTTGLPADINRLLADTLCVGGGGSYGDWAWDAHQSSFKGRISELVVTPTELVPATFKLLNTPKPGEVIVRPEAKPAESIALDLAGKTDLTVECFAKFPKEGAAGELFAFTPEGAPQFQLAAADGVLTAKVVPGTGGLNVETAAVPTDGAWHHVAMVVDGYAAGASRVRLYIDGIRSATHVERVNWTVPFTAGTFEVGNGFNGKVSSVRVTTGVVAPADFLSERMKSGMSVIIR